MAPGALDSGPTGASALGALARAARLALFRHAAEQTAAPVPGVQGEQQ